MQKLSRKENQKENQKLVVGKEILRYDLPRELRGAFNTIVKAKSPQDAISNVSTQEFNEIAYFLSENTHRIIIALNLLLLKILKSS